MNLHFGHKLRLAALILCAAFAAGVLGGCGRTDKISRDGFLFDTYITVSIYSAPDREKALDAAFDLCLRYDALFGKNGAGSDICRINSAEGNPVTVDPDTLSLLEKGLEYCRLSDGLLDITCGRVTRLWDFTSDDPALPDSDELLDALATVGYTAVVIDRENSTVTVPDGTLLDVGSIAKGFIADKICERLRSMGCTGAVINLGGNVYALGSKNGGPFSVGIQSPFDPGRFVKTLSVKDCSVVTAGSYQRCFTLDGKRYHHIIDLSDGMPAETGIASVTIISASSCDGDALATVCFLLGEEKAARLLETQFPDCEAYIVLESGEIRHILPGAV